VLFHLGRSVNYVPSNGVVTASICIVVVNSHFFGTVDVSTYTVWLRTLLVGGPRMYRRLL